MTPATVVEELMLAARVPLRVTGPEPMLPVAKDFKVQIVGRRGDQGVLVSVKRNRQEMEADKEMPRYAEVTAGQPGWRYDFAILEGGGTPGKKELRQVHGRP